MSVSAGDRVRPDDAAGPERGAGLADRSPVRSRVLLGPAGLRRDVRLDRDLARGRRASPRGSNDERTDALRPDVDREDAVAAHRPLLEEHARVHDPVRVEPRGRRRRAPSIPSSPFSAGEVRRVVAPDAVLVADRAAAGDDRLARRALQPPPAIQRLVRVGGDAGRRTSRRGSSRRVDVRQVAERVDPLADVVEAVAERPSERRREVRQPRPVDRGLERVERVAERPRACRAGPAPGTASRASAGRSTRRPRSRRGAGRSSRPRGRRASTNRSMPLAPTRSEGPLRPEPAQPEVARQESPGPRSAGQREQRLRSRAASRRGPSTAAGRPGPASRAASTARGQSGRNQAGNASRCGFGHRPHRRLGDDAEPALRSEDELAEVRARGRGRVGRQVERPGRRHDAAAGEQRLDPAEADRLLAGRPGGDPAAERRALERLGEVAEGQAVRLERRLEGRPDRARRRTSRGRSARRGSCSPASRSSAIVSVGRSSSAGRRDAADDARPAAERDDRGAAPSRRAPAASPDVVVGRRVGDGIRHGPEPPGPERDPVGQALAAGVADAILRIVGQERRRPRAATPARPRRRPRAARPAGGRRRQADLDLEQPPRLRRQLRGRALLAPAVPPSQGHLPSRPIVTQRRAAVSSVDARRSGRGRGRHRPGRADVRDRRDAATAGGSR